MEEFKQTNPIELKVKAKTLAAEAVIIKIEENKTKANLFRGKARLTLSQYAKEYDYPKPKKALPAGIRPDCIGDRIARDVIKRYIKTLTPEQYERFQRRRLAAWDRRYSLYLHRIMVVRPEARATHLARAFLKGKPYSDVEQKAYEFPLTGKLKPAIDKMVLRYGSGDRRHVQQTFEEWCQVGQAYHEEYWKVMKSDQKAKAILQGRVRLLQ